MHLIVEPLLGGGLRDRGVTILGAYNGIIDVQGTSLYCCLMTHKFAN